MKQGGVPAPSRIVDDATAREYFQHQGTGRRCRSARCRRTPTRGWGGRRWTAVPHDGVGFVVAELSPYQTDLDWSGLTEPAEMAEVLEQLGRATAKVHCVSDVDDASTPAGRLPGRGRRGAPSVEGREDELGRRRRRLRPLLRGAGAH
jgi:hypothetical protein